MDLRYRLHEDLLRAVDTIAQADREFQTVFGRAWGGLFWEYAMDDAEHVLVSMGSLASECTIAADDLRSQGLRTGVIAVRAYRPFPAAELCNALESANTVTVFEKDVSYGYAGALANDLRSALFDTGLTPKVSSYVAGLGGRDVRPQQLAEAAAEAILKRPTVGWIDVKGCA